MKQTEKNRAMESSASALAGMRIHPERARKNQVPTRREPEVCTDGFGMDNILLHWNFDFEPA